MQPLSDLARAAAIELPISSAKISITGITSDSRAVKPGTLFAALKGEKSDGAAFIPQAIKAGAAAILCAKGINVPAEVALLAADHPRLALAKIAAAFYGRQPEHMAAVTGTDGKTSTADFFRQFWHLMGQSSASIGTLGALDGQGKEIAPGSHTTPDPVSLSKLLADMASQHIDHVCMEASSHGLDQYRLDGVRLKAAAFTNLGRDHFDYHLREENYFAAKARLFSELLPKDAVAVLNRDDARYAALADLCKSRGIRVIGFGSAGEYAIDRIEPSAHGQRAEITLNGTHHTLEIPLAGAFQVMNILAALGLVEGTGGDLKQALAVIPKLKGVPGRIECVATLKNGAAVYVDYAHTPLALANILKTLRPHTKNKLHVVFGCGGDRDPGKRPEMGKIACQLADRIIVTDDNPRSEDPAAIRKAILAACPSAKEVADRKAAIYAAMEPLQAGDILVLAGKGHEETQTIGGQVLPFSDADMAREGARELKL